ncbi:hypothetical protein FHU30_008136 [Actinomadura rupiterrae]|nr:hypothetical protein [Actinomadura rupiterrae]
MRLRLEFVPAGYQFVELFTEQPSGRVPRKLVIYDPSG